MGPDFKVYLYPCIVQAKLSNYLCLYLYHDNAHCIVCYWCREQEEKSTEFKAAFSEYASWQKLPARDALGRVGSLQSQLRSISNFAPSMPTAPTGLRFSFELPCSDVLTSIGLLGRIHTGGARSCADSGDNGDRGGACPAGQCDMNSSQEESSVGSLSVNDSLKPPHKKPRK